jgi:hypothetical protein
MFYCVVPVTPSADPERSSLDINTYYRIIETRTAINVTITPDEYQDLW